MKPSIVIFLIVLIVARVGNAAQLKENRVFYDSKLGHIALMNIIITPEQYHLAQQYIKHRDTDLISFKRIQNDRYGNPEGYVFLNDQLLQAMLIEEKLAYHYVMTDTNYTDQLIAAELTHHDDYIEPEKLVLHEGKFVRTKLKIYDVAVKRHQAFLNTSPNWKDDVSVAVGPFALSRFDVQWLQNLKGKHIAVRGWVRDYNGPLIDVHHPSHMLILDE